MPSVHHIGRRQLLARRARAAELGDVEAAFDERLRLVEVVDVDGDGAVVAGLGRRARRDPAAA